MLRLECTVSKNFCRFNFINEQMKQKFLVSFFCIDCSQYVEPKIFQRMFVVLEMQLQIYGHLLKTKRAHHVESTLIRRRYYFDTSKTKFRRISTSFPCTFFDVISLVEKSSLFPRTFFGVISLVKISTLFPCILFDVISLVEISTFFLPWSVSPCFYLFFSTFL